MFINEAVNGVTWAVMSSFLCDGDTTGQVNSHMDYTYCPKLFSLSSHLRCADELLAVSLAKKRQILVTLNFVKSDEFWKEI